MIIATIRVSGVEAVAVDVKKVTAGLTGAEVVMEYTDPLWNGLTKKVVFDGAETVSAVGSGDRVAIPVEAVRQAGVLLRVGVYGVSSDDSLAIPTIWAEIGNVLPAVPGNSVGPGSQAVAEWAQILAMIGDLKNLTTEAKENLVAAINEVRAKGGGSGGINEDTLQEAINKALAQAKESGEFDGPEGADGKSAYAYAQEGGYAGTEAEFAEMLANGTGGGLPVPEKAEVGQFIVVSAVDENGKVTATEAVDAPVGEVLADAEGVAF